MNTLNILYIAPSIRIPGFDGGSTHVLEVSRNLVRMGHNVIVLARRSPGQTPFEVIDGVNIVRVWRGIIKPVSTDFPGIVSNPSRSSLKFFEKTYFNTVYTAYTSFIAFYLAKKYRADVILERGDSYSAGAYVSLVSGIPLITEIRDIYQPKISLLVARRLLVYDENVLRDKRFLSKIAIMRGGVDIEKFKPMNRQEAKAALGLLEKFVIGYSGSFAKSHRVDIMVMLAQMIRRIYGDKVHFLVVGPHNPLLTKMINSLNLRHYFSFIGPVSHDELPRYLSAMDVGLALYDPGKVAGPPYKVYEYMACGVPPITTETIYSRKIVKDSLNGFLVKMNNAEEVFNKLSLLIKNPDLLHEMSIKARETATKFSWKEEAYRVLKVIKEVLAQQGL
jgi:glycosyltransferase involved in cell wall biosynthesis